MDWLVRWGLFHSITISTTSTYSIWELNVCASAYCFFFLFYFITILVFGFLSTVGFSMCSNGFLGYWFIFFWYIHFLRLARTYRNASCETCRIKNNTKSNQSQYTDWFLLAYYTNEHTNTAPHACSTFTISFYWIGEQQKKKRITPTTFIIYHKIYLTGKVEHAARNNAYILGNRDGVTNAELLWGFLFPFCRTQSTRLSVANCCCYSIHRNIQHTLYMI